jgi:allantoin racemase
MLDKCPPAIYSDFSLRYSTIFAEADSVRVKVIIPVSTDKWDDSVKADYERVKQPETVIDIMHLDYGPEALQSEYNEAVAAGHVLKEVTKTGGDEYDAIIIYCFSDPGLLGAREISTIPVLSIGESSQLFAMGLADRCGIITTLQQSVARIRRKLEARGFAGRFPSVRPLDIPVLEYDQKEKVTERALEVARIMVKEDGAEALILGCGSLFGIREQIQEEMAVPVVEPGIVTLKHAEMLVSLGLSQSKRSYMTPLSVVEH